MSTGFRGAGRRAKKGKSLIRQLFDLAELASGRPVAADAPAAVPPAVAAEAARLLPAGPQYVALAPGAGGKHKCWPLQNFIALAANLAATGTVPVFILGPAEGDWAGPIRSALPDALLPLQDAADPSPLLTIALAARVACAVANDAGSGHMLAAAAPHMVSLFGPTPARKFAPRDDRIALLRAQDFGGQSMDAIPVDAVERAVRAVLP